MELPLLRTALKMPGGQTSRKNLRKQQESKSVLVGCFKQYVFRNDYIRKNEAVFEAHKSGDMQCHLLLNFRTKALILF